MTEIEVGGWFAYTGSLPSLVGRPVQVAGVEGELVLGRWASGTERLLERAVIGERVEDAVPGKTEPCMVCGGREITHKGPCPNCKGSA